MTLTHAEYARLVYNYGKNKLNLYRYWIVYRIEDFAKDSETQEIFVVYKAMYNLGIMRVFNGVERPDKEIAPMFSAARDIENICLPKSFHEQIY